MGSVTNLYFKLTTSLFGDTQSIALKLSKKKVYMYTYRLVVNRQTGRQIQR